MDPRNGSLQKTFLTLFALSLLALLATSCSLAPSTTPRASDSWSNGRMVGVASLNNQVALQVDEWGNGFLVWVDTDQALRLARLDDQATVVLDEALDLPAEQPSWPRLLLDPNGELHLSWLDHQATGSQVFYATLTADGGVVGEPSAISTGETRAAHYVMILDPVGETIEFLWSDNVPARPGIYHAAIDWSGTVVSPAELMIANGLLPSAQVDRDGYLHLAWRVESAIDQTEFHYAVYDPQRRALGPESLVIEPVAQMALLGGPTVGASFDGPWLGLDQTHVYLAWTLDMHERGTVQDFTFYQAFRPPELARRDLSEPFTYLDLAIAAETVHIQGVDPGHTAHPDFLPGQPPKQYASCFTQVSGRQNLETLQIAVVELGPRLVEGQQVVTGSHGASLRPSIATDGQGNLYVAWIDTAGFEQYQVLYASNSPQVKEVLNRITTYDVVDRIMSGVMTGLSSLIFVPVTFLWMILPLGYLVIYTMARSNVEFSEQAGRRTVLIAMALGLLSKLFFTPGLLDRFPFGPLLPPGLGSLLGRWIVPMVLTGVAAWIGWVVGRRSVNQSLFLPYLTFAVTDVVLMLIVYVMVPLVIA
jgi:hypothetical protein